MALRLQELAGLPLPEPWPEGVYPGEYVRDLAASYRRSQPDFNPEALDSTRWPELGGYAGERLRSAHESELERFGVHFDRWFSERSLRDQGGPEAVVAELDRRGLVYEHEGARWFRSQQFGDQKDHVVMKSNGEFTYLVPDAAYHADKFGRGYDIVINLLGPDHHGYLARMRAIVEALGYPSDHLEIRVIQMVRLLSGGEVVRMSKRGGNFVTLGDLMDEVGVDPARWFFLERSSDTPMDFDLDLAQLKTQENPVYYVQYAGARIHSILRAYAERGAPEDPLEADLGLLREGLEEALIRDVAKLPAVIRRAAEERAPQMMTRYLTATAQHLHGFYRQHRILEEAPPLRRARIELMRAVLVAIERAMGLIGVSVPERM